MTFVFCAIGNTYTLLHSLPESESLRICSFKSNTLVKSPSFTLASVSQKERKKSSSDRVILITKLR